MAEEKITIWEPDTKPDDPFVPQDPQGSVGGFSISKDVKAQQSGSGNASWNVDVTKGIWLGSAQFANAPFSVDMKGNVVATTLSVSAVKFGKTSLTDSVNAGYWINTDGFYFGSAADAKYLKYTIGSGAFVLNGATISASTLTALQAGSEISIQGWTSTLVFSSTDYDTVAWTAGAITLLDGTVFNIVAGNTGNIAALTYIYFSKSVSVTILQTSTTAADAVGSNKILVAVASPNPDTTSKATFQAFGGTGGVLLAVDSLAANSASVNEFISNTAQIKNAIITSAKIFSLDVGKLTTGSIISQQITLSFTDGAGDSYIAAGKTDFTNTDAGFILGIDDSDANTIKFMMGTATEYFNILGSSIVNSIKFKYIVGDVKISNASGESHTNAGAETHVEHITIGRDGEYRLKFQLHGTATNTVKAKVYKNGDLINWIASYTIINPGNYVQETLDLIGANAMVKGDYLDIYYWVDSGGDEVFINICKLCANVDNETTTPVVTTI